MSSLGTTHHDRVLSTANQKAEAQKPIPNRGPLNSHPIQPPSASLNIAVLAPPDCSGHARPLWPANRGPMIESPTVSRPNSAASFRVPTEQHVSMKAHHASNIAPWVEPKEETFRPKRARPTVLPPTQIASQSSPRKSILSAEHPVRVIARNARRQFSTTVKKTATDSRQALSSLKAKAQGSIGRRTALDGPQ